MKVENSKVLPLHNQSIRMSQKYHSWALNWDGQEPNLVHVSVAGKENLTTYSNTLLLIHKINKSLEK